MEHMCAGGILYKLHASIECQIWNNTKLQPTTYVMWPQRFTLHQCKLQHESSQQHLHNLPILPYTSMHRRVPCNRRACEQA